MGKIKTLEAYLEKIHEIAWDWHNPKQIWFRGQPIDKPLKPKLFRLSEVVYDENGKNQTFRNKALALGKCPGYSNHNEWLFLM